MEDSEAGHVVEIVRRRPHPALAGLVVGLAGLHEHSAAPVRRRQPAGSLIPLVLSFGDPLDVVSLSAGEGGGRSYGSFVAGLMPGHASTSFDRSQDCVQVYLTPRGAHRILGGCAGSVAGRVVAVDDLEVASVLGGMLPDRLHSATNWTERLRLVEQALLLLAARGPEPDDSVVWMWRRLLATGGQARITDLVARTGWSHRHVGARFREQLGTAPKLAASVIRFERASAELGHKPLAELASRHGYADQSHLCREVMRFAGESPLSLSVARRPTAHTALGIDPRGVRDGELLRV